MIILGIDPGIAIVGWGVVECVNGKFSPLGYGAITTGPESPVEDRLEAVYAELDGIIKRHKPDAVSVEELFWNTNQKTGIIVAEARGVILLAARKNNVPIFEYTPLQVKQSVTGYGRADKKQVITLVSMMLKLDEPPKPDDTADALALAITHGNASASKIAGFYNKASNAGYGRHKLNDPRFENATNIVRRGKTVYVGDPGTIPGKGAQGAAPGMRNGAPAPANARNAAPSPAQKTPTAAKGGTNRRKKDD